MVPLSVCGKERVGGETGRCTYFILDPATLLIVTGLFESCGCFPGFLRHLAALGPWHRTGVTPRLQLRVHVHHPNVTSDEGPMGVEFKRFTFLGHPVLQELCERLSAPLYWFFIAAVKVCTNLA